MNKLIKAGIITEDEKHANEALHTSLKIMRGPVDQKTALAAARTVLEWTRAKPAAKSEITVNSAEAWLEAVVADNGQAPAEPEDAGDPEAPTTGL